EQNLKLKKLAIEERRIPPVIMGTDGGVEERVDCNMESSPGLTEAKWFYAEEVPSWGSDGGTASLLTLEEGAIGKLEKENAAGAVVH
ncbi:hypothetical protein PIB30_098972, partial [Stylosanthes scabra]|nr:hypothetical protein [Stylosanthes scabra]